MKYQVLQALENNPEVSQRALAKQIGLSLGKTNYCLRAVIDRGWVKARNFKNSSNKSAYLYQLTPQGVSAKARVTRRFLDRKLVEFKRLEQEIERLRGEVEARTQPAPDPAVE